MAQPKQKLQYLPVSFEHVFSTPSNNNHFYKSFILLYDFFVIPACNIV